MGRYIEWDDLVGRYRDIGKLSGAESVGSHHIQYAESEIDARLAPRYTVPFSSGTYAPMTVKDLCIDLAYLKATMGGRSKTWSQINSHVDKRIKQILDGDLQVIDYAGSPLAVVGQTIWSSTSSYTPIFGLGDTEEFIADPDRLEDETDDRE